MKFLLPWGFISLPKTQHLAEGSSRVIWSQPQSTKLLGSFPERNQDRFPYLVDCGYVFSSSRELWKITSCSSCTEPFARRFLAMGGATGDSGFIPVLERSPGEGNGNPLRYSCLGNPMDRGAWRTTVYGVAQRWTCLNMNTCVHTRTHTHKVQINQYTEIENKSVKRDISLTSL